MSEWDKLVSGLDQVHGSEITLSADGWLDESDGKQSNNLHERILKVEVELINIGRTLENLQKMVKNLDDREFVSRLDDSNERLRTIRNAIAIQGPTFGYLLLAAGCILGVLGTLKFGF